MYFIPSVDTSIQMLNLLCVCVWHVYRGKKGIANDGMTIAQEAQKNMFGINCCPYCVSDDVFDGLMFAVKNIQQWNDKTVFL